MDLFSIAGNITVKFEDAIRGIDEVSSKAGNLASSLGSTMQDAGGKISSVGKAIAPVSVAVGGVATTAIKTAADFDSAMSQVSAISGATGEDFEALRNKAREMGSKTKFSATEAAEAMNYMAMAGWGTSDMLSGIDGIMNLAAASGEDLATTSDIVTDALTAFGLSAEDSGHFADILAAASSNANTNVSMMGETFKYCAPVAGALGFSAEDTAEAIGLMANAGIKSSQAGTAMRTILSSLTGEITFTGDAFGEMSVQTTNADGSMRDLGDILADCRVAFSQMSESEQAANAEALVGREAMSGFLAVMNAGEGDVEKLSGAIENCDGTSASMAATMQDNLQGQITTLMSQLQELAISFGDLLMPKIREIVEHIQSFVDKLNGMDEGTKTAIINIGLFIAALAPILIIGGTIISGIGTFITVFSSIAGVVSTVIGFVSSTLIPGIAAVVSSIGLVPIAIAALVAGIVAAGIAIWQNWDTIKEKAAELWGNVKEKFGAIKDSIVDAFSKAKEAVVSKVEEIKTNASEGWENMKATVSSKMEEWKSNVSNKLNEIKTNFASKVDEYKTTISNGWETMKTTITTKMGEWKSNASTKLSEIKTNFTTKVSEIKADWSSKFTNIKDTATNMMQTARQNISSKLTEVKTNFSTKISEIKTDWSTKFTNIKDTAIDRIQTAKQNTSTRLSEMKTNFSSRVSAIKSDWSTKFDNIKDAATNRMQTARQNVSAKLDNIKTAFNEKGGGIKGIAAATFVAVKETIDTQMQGANVLTGGKLDSIRSAFSGKLDGVRNTVYSVMGNIKSAFSDRMEDAKSAVHNAIEKIKGFFNFNWSLPKIKLPHFSISGKFSLDPPSIPSFGVQWYAKAMKDGMIMNQPTIFGYNAKSNQLLAGGEAGSETVVGTESLMNMIKSAVSSENGELIEVLREILKTIVSLDEELEGKFYNALLNMRFQINEREFARLVKAV